MSSIKHAYETIKNRLGNGSWKAGQRLPSIEQLAKLCAVSRTTMWQALKLLQQESLVSAKRGGAIIAGAMPDPATGTEESGYAWERLKNRIGREILQGEFSNLVLPPIAKLAIKYGAAIDTVKKALKGLLHDGHLVHEGRTFSQAPKTAIRYRPTIVLIADESQGGGMFLYDMRTNQIVESLERECVRLGYSSRFIGFGDKTPNGLLDARAALKKIGTISGFVVNMWWVWNETNRQRWFDLLGYLAGQKVPVIVIDQAGNLEFPHTIRRAQNFRVVRITGERAGEIAGHTLMRQGHNIVAYVTAYHKTDWARNRYNGLHRYYEQFGGGSKSVELFARSEVNDQNDLILSLMDLDEKEILAVYSGRYSAEDVRALRPTLERIRNLKLSKKSIGHRVTRTLRPMAHVLADLSRSEHDAAVFEGMQTVMLHLADSSAQELYLQPLFSEILEKSKATAWVCSDDKTGMDALAFLKSKGKRVPNDISVLCFENYRGAVKHQLSAYDFNLNGMVQKALLMIMDRKTLKSTPVISEVDGYVVERRTTRR
jgi:DNA-binding LacI/PurR family transcriptional regulator/DNA-binding transcriptional regulator YhcF (GntR family)